MKKISILFTLFIGLIMFSCSEKPKEKIVQKQDFENLLAKWEKPNPKLKSVENEINYWENKLQNNRSHLYLTKLSGLYQSLFDLTGNANYLIKTDDLLLEANQIVEEKKAGIWQMLSANAIMQHQFQLAEKYILQAKDIKDNQYGSQLMMFDTYMELGEFSAANFTLNKLGNKSSFDYLVRLSKWKDHIGELDSAIYFTEIALGKISSNKTELKCWALANLGDMYGHAGRIQDSYDAFLKVLEKNPYYAHAWKGIAWIAYANDGNTKLASEILNKVVSQISIPDYHLILAEIQEFEGDQTQKKQALEKFLSLAKKPETGLMYNTYKFQVFLEENKDIDAAIQLANAEVQSRPTPQSYALLAWGHYKNNEYEKAVKIIKEKVEGKTYEPNALYYAGMIYSKTNAKLAKKYLSEAAEAEFELGPVTSKAIQNGLAQL